MRRQQPNTIILSVESNDYSDITNDIRSNEFRAWLSYNSIDYKEVIGCYRYDSGDVCRELSFVITNSKRMHTVINKALNEWEQECVLYLDSDRNAKLLYKDKDVSIGKFKAVNKANISKLDAYTYDPTSNQFYACI